MFHSLTLWLFHYRFVFILGSPNNFYFMKRLNSIKRSARGFRDGGVRPLDDVADEAGRKMPGFRIVEHAPGSIVQVIRSAVGHPEARSGLFFEQH